MKIKKVIFSIQSESGVGVEIESLFKILNAFQRAFWKIGEYSLTGEIKREKGKLPEQLARGYTLRIISINKGSLSVALELPSQSLFHTPEDDLGKLLEIIKSISEDRGKIRELLPDEKLRRKVLMDLKEMCPSRVKKIKLNGMEIPHSFTENVKEILSITTTQKEEEFIGPVVEVKLVDPMYFGILHNNKIIKMSLKEEYVEMIIENLSKVVKVRTLVKKEEETGKEEVMEVLDIESIEENRFEIEELEYGGKVFLLAEPLCIEIDYKDELWILQNKELGIVAWGERFDIAWESFREDFWYLWEEIGKENEAVLDFEAVKLKRQLNEMIIEVKEK